MTSCRIGDLTTGRVTVHPLKLRVIRRRIKGLSGNVPSRAREFDAPAREFDVQTREFDPRARELDVPAREFISDRTAIVART